MSKITGKVNYKSVLKGDTGYTYKPHVTTDGVLYWSNNGNLPNPLPVNIKGKNGDMAQQEEIENINIEIEKINKKALPIILINAEKDFDKNDISKTINRLIENNNDGVTLFLKDGQDYILKNTINFNKRQSLILNGKIKCVNTNIAIKIKDDASTFNNGNKVLYLSNLITDSVDTGIEINNCYNAEFKIGYIRGFNKCINLYPNKDNQIFDEGVQYCVFNFNLLKSNELSSDGCINFKGGDFLRPWINENTFIGGRIIGSYGLMTRKGLNQWDRFNNNKFYNIGFEGIENNGIDLNFTINNVFENLRFEGIKGLFIKDENSSYNEYNISQLINQDKLLITSNNTFLNFPIVDDGGVMISYNKITNIYGSKNNGLNFNTNIIDKNKTGISYCENNKNIFERFAFILTDEEGNKNYIPCKESKTKLIENVDFTLDYLYKDIRIISNERIVRIKIPNKFKYDGAEFNVSTNYNTNDIIFIDEENNEEFKIENSEGLGTWNILFVQNRGKFTKLKISDKFRLF